MVKSIKIFILILTGILVGPKAFTQYYVKFKGDSVGFEIDSVILAIKARAGSIDWEISKDSVTWQSLNESNDTLLIRIDSGAFYRAILSEGTCYPVKSDVAFVSFKTIYITDDVVVIDSTGGVYLLPSGIRLIVPPDAVKENTMLTFNKLDSVDADLKLPFDADTGKVYGAGIYCGPSGTGFLKPVRINVPVPDYEFADLPFVYMYNLWSEEWNQYTGILTCSEERKFIEFSTDLLFPVRIELIKDVLAPGKTAKKSDKKGIECHEILASIKNSSHYAVGHNSTGECYVFSDKLEVRFPACIGDEFGIHTYREIGPDCRPEISPSIGTTCLKEGESTKMKFKVYFSFTLTDQVFPLKDQNVTISVPAGLTVSKHSLTTDDAGETEEVTVTCNVPNFKGEIEYILLARYYLQEVYAKSEDRTEYNPKDPVSFQKKETIVIGCDPPVLKTLMLYGGNPTMLKGETNPVACHGIDQYGHEITIPPESIEYFIQDQEPPNVDVVSIGENSVTAVNPGAASIRARHIPSGKESIYSAHFAVAYTGILEPKETSNDVCKCKEDLPFFLDNWWIVKYEGIWNIKLWISTNKSFNAPSAAKLVGTNTITYDITGMYNTRCAPYTFSEHLDITGVLSRNSTIEQMLNGALIQFSFWYEDFLGRFKTIDFNAIMDPATNSINIGLNHYWPDDCVNYVYSNGRLQ